MFNLFRRSPKSYQNLDAETFAAEIDAADRPLILDVRSPAEFQMGHLSGAKNINVMDRSFQANIQKLNSNQPVYVYCKSGARSKAACGVLSKQGFEEIYNLRGGVMAWHGQLVG